jgi:hypothetical protein
MRHRMDAGEALSFGYISPPNAAKLAEIAATVYAAQFDFTPQMQSTAATLLPQLLPRLIGSAAWSAREGNGGIEDRYVFRVPASIARRLREPFAATGCFRFEFRLRCCLRMRINSRYIFSATRKPRGAGRKPLSPRNSIPSTRRCS